MGLYADHVLPRVINLTCGTKSVDPLRQRVCAGLTGDVVEVGFGSGLNVAHYPATVRRVVAIEPSDTAWHLAAARVGAARVPVERSGLDGQSLPFADGTFDSALSTWTLCTIPDLSLALGELRRVLRSGASLHFLEHGLAPDERVRRMQRRVDPLQARLAGGCHLNRPIVDQLTAAGFTVVELEQFYLQGAPKSGGAMKLGRAVTPT